ncbi:MAG: hypothetical protein N3D20_01120 [Candidatus Pacearchaeota archaeon]|nr:hypothetical protein [Candidatus Pacearchaeota archaeon]
MKKAGILTIIICLMFIEFVSAEISISQPAPIYNVGDRFNLNIVLSSKTNLNDIFITKIVCNSVNGTQESEIYKMPQSVVANQPKTILVDGYFGDFLINGMRGECSFVAGFANEKATSQKFEISDEIKVNAGFEKFLFSPGEEVKVYGKAIKKNGQLVNGYVEVIILDLGIDYLTSINNGELNFSFYIPEKAKAREQEVLIKVYEKNDFGTQITNKGEVVTNLAIRQQLKKADIAVNSERIKPGNELDYKIVLFDQAGELIEKQDIYARVYAPDGSILEEKITKSEEMNTIAIKTNFMPGVLKIEAIAGDIRAEKKVNIEELEMIDYKLENDVLTITNIGNIRYKKNIEIFIGEAKETKELDLGVGESKKFVLKAPNGEYRIRVNDGYEKKLLGSAPLTGRSVSVDEEGAGLFNDISFLWMWVVLFVMVGGILLYHFVKVYKLPYFAFGSKSTINKEPIKINDIKTAGKGNLLDNGVKEICSVVAIKIRNMSEIINNKDAIEIIENVMTKARERGGKTYSNENGSTIVFSPSITNDNENNHLIAIRSAKELEQTLKEFNNRAKKTIKFGIGVHIGEMIKGTDNDKIKFMPIGNTLSLARQIAEKAIQEAIISGAIHRKTLGKIKAERIDGDNLWRVHKIIERDRNSEFITKFLERQKREEMGKELKEKRAKFLGRVGN